MGIKGLVQWAKTAHPDAIKTFPRRWNSPEIRGKRIAIDGTLMTNRFHFAQLKSPLASKSGLIGWYQCACLINEMRRAGMKPIAVWDKPGHRPWKEPEARKRTFARAQQLARHSFEDERADRLADLREAILAFDALPPADQELVRDGLVQDVPATTATDDQSTGREVSSASGQDATAHAAPTSQPLDMEASDKAHSVSELATAHDPSLPPKEQPEGPKVSPKETRDQTSGLREESTAAIASLQEMFASLIDRHREFADRTAVKAHTKPETKASLPAEVDDALEHVRELEELHEELYMSRPTAPPVRSALDGHTLSVAEITALEKARRELDQSVVDEKILETIPIETFHESRTQRSLTDEEGDLIESLIVPPPVLVTEQLNALADAIADASTQLQELPSSEAIVLEEMLSPLERLEQLLERQPLVQGIYARALNQPTLANHATCKDLLRRMGVPVVEAEAPFEAEGLASAMAKEGLVDFVGTEDSDVLAYQGPMLRNVSNIKLPLTLLDGRDLQVRSTLSPSAYIDFCILLGTDASPRLHKVGPVTAFKLIQKHSSIEQLLEAETSIAEKVPDGWLDMVRNARELFMRQHVLPDESQLQEGVCDAEEVEKWLVEQHGFGAADSDEMDWSAVEPFSDTTSWDAQSTDSEIDAIVWDNSSRLDK